MAAVEFSDGSEDVNDFLKRIRELGEKRDKEDAERTKKLEEDILEGRRQREVRRAERARSLSPEKQSPSTTPRSIRSPRATPKPDLLAVSPSVSAASRFNGSSLGVVLDEASTTSSAAKGATLVPPIQSPSRDTSGSTSNPAGAPSTAITSSTFKPLSWQQRQETLRGSRSRPLSMVESQTIKMPPFDPALPPADDTMPSRPQISQVLASKDPSWFRQTPDRVAVALPKGRADDMAKHSNLEKMKLVGMSQMSPEKLNPQSKTTSGAEDSVQADATLGTDRESTLPGDDRTGLASVLANKGSPIHIASSQHFEPSALAGSTSASSATTEMPAAPSYVSERFSAERLERPLSPTKGMGGFVQSAMLKRSDSINKRWSAQAPAGVSRQESSTSLVDSRSPTRSGFSALQTSQNVPKFDSKYSFTGGDDSVEPKSTNVTQRNRALIDATDDHCASDGQRVNSFEGRPARPTPSNRDDANESSAQIGSKSPPPSPSKRWSPIKSTWLESALSKPESPIPKPTTPQQPVWLSEIQKNKKERAEKTSSISEDAAYLNSRAFAPTDGNRIAPDYAKTAEKSNVKTPPTKPKPFVLTGESPLLSNDDIRQPKTPPSSETPVCRSSPSSLLVRPDTTPSSRKHTEAVEEHSHNPQKPVTPPKKDFRSNLKPSHATSPTRDAPELEFRNVFGKLKRTNTEKYIAPDEFKGNILKGKAALSVTGGPQKSVRRDEFKESILERKESMREKALGSNHVRVKPSKPEISKPPPPEAIARSRSLMNRDNIFGKPGASKPTEQLPEVAAQAEISSARREETNSTKTVKMPLIVPSQAAIIPSSGTSKLANRFNPGLGEILAKRSPAGISTSANQSSSALPPMKAPDSFQLVRSVENGKANTPLQHMTKARAKGPKRRGPTNMLEGAKSGNPRVGVVNVDGITNETRNSAVSKTDLPSSKPYTPVKSPSLILKTSNAVDGLKEAVQATPASRSPPLPSKPQVLRSADHLRLNAPKNSSQSRNFTSASNSLIFPAQSVDVARIAQPIASTTSLNLVRMAGPINVSANANEKMPAEDFSSTRSNEPNEKKSPEKIMATSPQGNLVESTLRSIDDSNARIRSLQPTIKSSETLQKNDSETMNSRDSVLMISDLFKEIPVLPSKLDLDAESLIVAKKEDSAISETEKSQIGELTGDGKFKALPSNQEHILHDCCMYICTHTFSDAKKTRTTEVFLWVGASVPESTLEDAQLFAKKTAKDNNTKLVILRQGKETESFFQAIGGILVTRRGTPASNSQSYMLCARQHLGHVAFDEVNMELSSLCSGYPFIITTISGKAFLWKGIGCNAEELGCARLIIMDLSQTGEVIEIGEGQETAGFLAAFPKDSRRPGNTAGSHWHLKPNHNYKTRLFQIEYPSKTNVMEISPFVYTDLSPSNIYMLDSFFQIFIVIGSRTQSKAQSFSYALLFAQEYAIVTTSTEERPFVPAIHVLVEGITPDITACFRGWDGKVPPTKTPQSGRAKFMTLSNAIESVKTSSKLPEVHSSKVSTLEVLQFLRVSPPPGHSATKFTLFGATSGPPLIEQYMGYSARMHLAESHSYDGFVLTISDDESVTDLDEISMTSAKRKGLSQDRPSKKRKISSSHRDHHVTEFENVEDVDGDFDPAFEFDLGDHEGVTNGFVGGWNLPTNVDVKMGNKISVDTDDIILQRRARGAAREYEALDSSEGSLENDQDAADSMDFNVEDFYEEEASEDEGFGTSAPQDNSECKNVEFNGSEDEEETAAPVPHPYDDLGDDISEDEEPHEIQSSKEKAFFAPEDIQNEPKISEQSFQNMSLSRPILKGLNAVGFTTPTPIQVKTVPVALLGKDVVGGAVTGSGKTAAFIIPILERLLYRPKKVPTTRVTILMPTRELAVQCYNVATRLATFTDITFSLLVGGLSVREQEQALKKRPDIVIATPGRFIDHMRNSASFAIENIEILVLDEADRMLEDGFADELNEILSTIPKSRQTMLFSATMTQNVDKLIRAGLQRPVRLMVDAKRQTVEGLVQEFIKLKSGKGNVEEQRLAYLLHLCSEVYTTKTIVFFPRKDQAHRVKVIFALCGIKAAELHGSMSQEQRLAAISSFRDGQRTHLLATDLASRGLDIPHTDAVLNFTVPSTVDTYLHRVGRTARAGRSGVACTLFVSTGGRSKSNPGNSTSERSLLRPILRLARSHKATVRTRTIPAANIEKMTKRLTLLEIEIDAVLLEEKEQKLVQQTERDIAKGENLVRYEHEIASRPKRTWFQSEKEKKAASQLGRLQQNGSTINYASLPFKKEKRKLSGKTKKSLSIKDDRRDGKLLRKKGKEERAGRGVLKEAKKLKRKSLNSRARILR